MRSLDGLHTHIHTYTGTTTSSSRSLAVPRARKDETVSNAHAHALSDDMSGSHRDLKYHQRGLRDCSGANEKTPLTEERKEAVSFELRTLSTSRGDRK